MSTSVTPIGFQAKPVNIVARSHSVIAQAPASASTSASRLVLAEPPRQPGGEHRIDGEVERQQHHRDPAEPGRHRRLEGEGGRDPVEADDELADAEPPADQQRAAQRLRRARPARTARRRRAASAATSRPARTRRRKRRRATSAIRKCIASVASGSRRRCGEARVSAPRSPATPCRRRRRRRAASRRGRSELRPGGHRPCRRPGSR